MPQPTLIPETAFLSLLFGFSQEETKVIRETDFITAYLAKFDISSLNVTFYKIELSQEKKYCIILYAVVYIF